MRNQRHQFFDPSMPNVSKARKRKSKTLKCVRVCVRVFVCECACISLQLFLFFFYLVGFFLFVCFCLSVFVCFVSFVKSFWIVLDAMTKRKPEPKSGSHDLERKRVCIFRTSEQKERKK